MKWGERPSHQPHRGRTLQFRLVWRSRRIAPLEHIRRRIAREIRAAGVTLFRKTTAFTLTCLRSVALFIGTGCGYGHLSHPWVVWQAPSAVPQESTHCTESVGIAPPLLEKETDMRGSRKSRGSRHRDGSPFELE